jgi:WD40 repeat protein/tetratricopeptide (TPR) repeat protein/serine/threonine protein kinase
MSTSTTKIEHILAEAVEIGSPRERQEFLQRACGEDAAIRKEVDRLLHNHFVAGSFLETTPSAIAKMGAGPTLDQSPTERLGAQIGPYKLLQQIGEGGMGVVYMAEQEQPVRRRVALKIIKPGMDSRQVIARFEAERQALSLMDHPNIAKVLDAGTTASGRPYFVMELVKGQPITRYCDEKRLSLKERLELLIPVCQAIQHAHQKGIIHRDIKPTNILVAEYDQKAVPKVIDFGVAKATSQTLTEMTMFTGFGQIVGTLEYMSPEQAKVNQLDIDTRSDIYSLGVLLYELLTGSTPFDKQRLRSAAFDEMLRIIREEEPPKPSTRLSESNDAPMVADLGTSPTVCVADGGGAPHVAVRSSLASIAAVRGTEPARLTRLVRGELDWIVMKALEKDRSRRYESASGLARDIERYLNDEPVQACPPSAAYRFRKFARRNKAALATASLVGLAVVASMVVLAVSNVRIRHETREREKALGQAEKNFRESKRQEKLAKGNAKRAAEQTLVAQANAKAAKALEQLARRRFYAAQTNLAMQAWRAGDIPRALELLEGQRPKPGEEDLRGFEWFYLWRLCYGDRRVPIAGHKAATLALAFAPDGKTLVSGSADGTTRLWNTVTGEPQGILRASGDGIWFVACSRDGKWLASSDRWRTVTVWDAVSQKPIHTLIGSIGCISFSRDSKYLVGGLVTPQGIDVVLWDLATGMEHARVVNGGFPIGLLADDKTVFTMSDQHQPAGRVAWWSLETGQKLRSRPLPNMNCAAISPDGTRVAAALWNVVVWNAATGDVICQLPHKAGVRSLAFTPDNRFLAVGKEDKTVTVWNLDSQRPVGHDAHLDHVWSVAFSPDGSHLASSTLGGAIKLWDLLPTKEAATIPLENVKTLQFAPDSRALLVGNAGLTRIVDVQAGAEVAALPLSGAASFSKDTQRVALLTDDHQASIWDLPANREVARLPLEGPGTPAVALSADGQQAATYRYWGDNKWVQVWDLTRNQARKLQPQSGVNSINCAEFSPNGKLLAAGFQFQQVSVWELSSGRIKFEFDQQPFMMIVIALAFSADSRMLAVGTDVGSVTLWEVASGKQITACTGHALPVRCLAFSPDGKTLATGSDDHTVKLWDTLTGQERCTFSGHAGPVTRVQFSPDGNTLATASGDKTVKLWRAATDARALAPRLLAGGGPATQSDDRAPLVLPTLAFEPSDVGLRAAIERWPSLPDLHLALSRQLQSKGRLAEAESSLAEAVRIVPKQIQIRLHLAEVLRQQQKFTEAESALRDVIQLDPERPWTYDALGWLLMDAKKFAEAELAFRESLSRVPQHEISQRGLGQSLYEQRRLDEATVELRKAIRLAQSDPHAYGALGWALFDTQQLAEAVAAFQEAVRLEPSNANFHWGLGRVLFEQREYSAAVQPLREAFRLDPSLSYASNYLKQALAHAADAPAPAPPKVIDPETAFRQAIERSPNSAEPQQQLAELLISEGRLAEAEQCLTSAVRLAPERLEAYQRLAEVLSRLKKFSQAEEQLQSAIARDASQPWLYESLGWALVEQQKSAEAEQAFREAIRLQPGLPSAQFGLGKVLQDQKKFAEAIGPLRESLRLDSMQNYIHGHLGWIFIEQQMWAEAEAEFREQMRAGPDEVHGHIGLARVFTLQKKLAEAETVLHEAISIEPDEPAVHDMLGWVLIEQKRFAPAEEAFREAIRLAPGLATARRGLASALRNQGKWKETLVAAQEAIRLDPLNRNAHDLLGWALVNLEQFPEAERAFREAIRLEPDVASGYFGLGKSLNMQKKYAEAETVLRQAVHLNPNHAGAHDLLGWALFHQQKHAEAETVFRVSVRLTPEKAAVHYGLGCSLVEQQKFAEAETAVREALRLDPAQRWAPGLLKRALAGQGKPPEKEEPK